MARPKEFDVDEVLDRAISLFRANGFEATSMQDLVGHLGINRGSIYGTFESKERLYQLALDRYIESGRSLLDELLTLDLPLRARLELVLIALVANAKGRGCLVVNTACERNHQHPPSKQATTEAFAITRGRLVEAFEAGEQSGELRASLTPQVAADLILLLAQGLLVMTTTDADETTLGPVINATLDQVTWPHRATHP